MSNEYTAEQISIVLEACAKTGHMPVAIAEKLLQSYEQMLRARDMRDPVTDGMAKGAQHPDDAAVDAFAEAMKAKLAEARRKGRSGWQDKQDCSQSRLSNMLRDHVEKGDPRDVANFCMFLHQRGESILPSNCEPDAFREALERIKKLPRKPFPDPYAHSWEAFGRAVMGAFTDARMTSIRALGAAPSADASHSHD